MSLSLVKAHRLLAAGLALFILTHFAVHLTAIGGLDMHIAVLSKIQPAYRNWIIEPILMLAILLQVVIGGKLVWRRWKSPYKGFWGWAQILSGAYLGFFLLAHSSAMLFARHIAGLETNFYYAAAPLNIAPLQFLFAPYYTLGIVSVFAHLGAALYFGRPKKNPFLSWAVIGFGVTIALTIVATFGGAFFDIQIPRDYVDFFDNFTR